MNPNEFIQQHAPHGEMTADQAAQLLELMDQGDTDALSSESGSEPDAAPVVAESTEGVQATGNVANTDDAAGDATEVDPAKAVVMAKDGIHTISYDKLVEAREGRKTAEAAAQDALQKLADAQKEMDALRSEAQNRADAGIAPTATDQNLAAAEAAMDAGVDPGLFGDFSEEAIAKGVQAIYTKGVPALVEQLVKQHMAPLQQQQAMTERDAHEAAIYAKHPDADSVFESTELKEWIAAQPAYAKPGIEAVLANGSTAQVIEFIDTYKAATGKTQAAAAPSAESVQAAAKQAIAAAKPPVPTSLSDIPGGRAGPATGNEALANLGALDMAEALMDKTPEQIEAFLNRSF